MKEESTKEEGRAALPLARLDWALIALLAAVAIIARAAPGPRTIDDAYITFRYARNIAEGVGFVYTPASTSSAPRRRSLRS
ncbi:MAG: hypothetical protein M5R40_11595 [Anaerolineae bacterium]|nr:hypothetical protein [Anaerolineae bacterium]